MALKQLQSLGTPAEAYKNLRKMAIIDVGSNSFRLIVITYVPGYYFQLTDEVHESVRLVQGLSKTGLMRTAPMEHAVETMELYAGLCKASQIYDIAAGAPSAVRECKNRHELLERIKRDSEIKLR